MPTEDSFCGWKRFSQIEVCLTALFAESAHPRNRQKAWKCICRCPLILNTPYVYFITITRYVPLVGAVPNRRTTPALSCRTSTRHSLKLPSVLYL